MGIDALRHYTKQMRSRGINSVQMSIELLNEIFDEFDSTRIERDAAVTELGYLRPEVRQFAQAMEAQLQKNEHKGGWRGSKKTFLLNELEKNLVCLTGKALYGGEKTDVICRAVNVANFAMMISDVCGTLGGDIKRAE